MTFIPAQIYTTSLTLRTFTFSGRYQTQLMTLEPHVLGNQNAGKNLRMIDHITWTKKYRLIWKLIRVKYLKLFVGNLTRKWNACIMHVGAGYTYADQIM